MKSLMMFWILSFTSFNGAPSANAGQECFAELTCTGRVQHADPVTPTSSDEDLLIAFYAIHSTQLPSLPELQALNPARIESLEAACNQERYHRSTFGSNSWNEDSRLLWMKLDLKCYAPIVKGGTCRSIGQACTGNGDCCSNDFSSCDLVTQACKRNSNFNLPRPRLRTLPFFRN